jgi:hypothetical protein
VALGYLCYWFGDENAAWWSVGFILAGLVFSSRRVLART